MVMVQFQIDKWREMPRINVFHKEGLLERYQEGNVDFKRQAENICDRKDMDSCNDHRGNIFEKEDDCKTSCIAK